MSNPNALEPVPQLLAGLPDPTMLSRALRESINAAYASLFESRGLVTTPEDTFDMHRRLAHLHELLAGYARTFYAARKQVAGIQEEELVEALGEQEGTPNGSLTIPDPEGDIQVGPAFENSYAFDVDQIVAVVVANTVAQADTEDLADLMIAAVETVLRLGKFEPQVSKVRAYAADTARRGDDSLAGVLNSAYRKTRTYKGVTHERKRHA